MVACTPCRTVTEMDITINSTNAIDYHKNFMSKNDERDETDNTSSKNLLKLIHAIRSHKPLHVLKKIIDVDCFGSSIEAFRQENEANEDVAAAGVIDRLRLDSLKSSTESSKKPRGDIYGHHRKFPPLITIGRRHFVNSKCGEDKSSINSGNDKVVIVNKSSNESNLVDKKTTKGGIDHTSYQRDAMPTSESNSKTLSSLFSSILSPRLAKKCGRMEGILHPSTAFPSPPLPPPQLSPYVQSKRCHPRQHSDIKPNTSKTSFNTTLNDTMHRSKGQCCIESSTSSKIAYTPLSAPSMSDTKKRRLINYNILQPPIMMTSPPPPPQLSHYPHPHFVIRSFDEVEFCGADRPYQLHRRGIEPVFSAKPMTLLPPQQSSASQVKKRKRMGVAFLQPITTMTSLPQQPTHRRRELHGSHQVPHLGFCTETTTSAACLRRDSTDNSPLDYLLNAIHDSLGKCTLPRHINSSYNNPKQQKPQKISTSLGTEPESLLSHQHLLEAVRHLITACPEAARDYYGVGGNKVVDDNKKKEASSSLFPTPLLRLLSMRPHPFAKNCNECQNDHIESVPRYAPIRDAMLILINANPNMLTVPSLYGIDAQFVEEHRKSVAFLGYTPLHWALLNYGNDTSLIRCLIEAACKHGLGADVISAQCGFTAGATDAEETILLPSSYNLCANGSNGDLPLHTAIAAQNPMSTIQLLLSHSKHLLLDN